ncbi:MAG: DUF4115 domain-containing protein [Paracoccaceae bacterium]
MIGRKGTPSATEAEKPKGFDDFELRLGDLMRGERATLGKSLLDVQRELKLKATYIAAIENCDVSAFETPGFIAGYVRSYARYLGMDPEWAYAKFCHEANFTVAHGMSAAASSPRVAERRAKRRNTEPLGDPNAMFVPRGEALFATIEPRAVGSLLVLVALIGAIGYGGWSVLQQVQQVRLTPVDQAPGVVAELDVLPPEPSLPAPADEADSGPVLAANEGFDRLYRPQALDVPVLTSRDGPIAAIDPRTNGALADEAAAEEDATAFAGLGAEAEAEIKVVADAEPSVEIVAARPSWVRVSAADGTVLFEKILDAGERYVVPQTEEPALLRAGNSGSVYFAVNGQTYGPAAPGAQVVKNVALSVASLTEGYALADLGGDPDLAAIVAVAEAQTAN